jgi:hypothetical protein
VTKVPDAGDQLSAERSKEYPWKTEAIASIISSNDGLMSFKNSI